MNELPESSNNDSGADLDYLRGVKSSTCLLLPTTPSPHPMDFQHPLSDQMSEGPFLTLTDDPNSLQNLDTSAGDSSSSADSNSVTNVQDPVSAQLINNISMLEYQTLSKNADLIMGQTDDVKLNGNLNMNSRKLPGFVNWNWIIIRKVLLWVVVSGLVACLGTIIAMVVTIPTDCNPNLPWHQGKVFYEVFPASFKDSNNDGIGDLKGLIKKLDYIEELGISAIRLNHIFEATYYPENYHNITSLLKVDRSIGTLKDFQNLVAALHDRNMYLVLDIPVISMASSVSSPNINATRTVLLANNSLVSSFDQTSAAIAFWARAQNVDGFYLKDLEDFVEEVNFGKTLQIWKQMIGSGKIFIASEEAYKKAKGESLNVLLSRIDLIDVHLDARHGVTALKERIDEIITGTLWSKPHYPWVHWNIGNIDTERVSTKNANNTLAFTALEFALPGTVSIFYGDEIGLGDASLQDLEHDFQHVHNLVPMKFLGERNVENAAILSWNPKSSVEAKYQYIDVIKNLIQLRLTTPTIYLRSILKEGNVLKNTEIRKTENNLVVIERWFPRRNTCVFVGNLGKTPITTDLTSMFYGGTVMVGTNSSLVGQELLFEEITFPPNSGIILKLEK